MEESNKKKANPILDYIKKWIFFCVPKEQKNYAKKETMKAENKIFLRMIIFIAISQLLMIIFNIVSNLETPFSAKDKAYAICYLSLLFLCIITYPIASYLAKTGKYRAYYIVVGISIQLLFDWSCAITLIDSFSYGIDLTTFAYTILAVTAFIMLEPWIFIIDSMLFSGIILCFAIFNPAYSDGFHLGIVISLITISLLTSLAATSNFRKRILMLEVKKENEVLTESLAESSIRDDLTKAYNRRYLTQHIDDLIYIGLHPSGALMLDIDDFKTINDQYGHLNGDLVLHDVCKVILDKVHALNDNSYVVRYGGEEFLVFIEHTSQVELFDFAETLRKEIEQTEITFKDGTTVKVNVSIGCSIATSGITYSHLINVADDNLYASKEAGKNKITFK